MIEQKLYREIVDKMPILCVDCIVYHDYKYLLLKRKNEPLKGMLWVPGGRVLKGETAEEAVHRIMKKETGLDVTIEGFKGYYEDYFERNDVGVDLKHTVSLVFMVRPKNTNVVLDEQSSGYKWSDNIPYKLRKGIK